MTVAELLDHFDVYPSEISYYNSTENVDDTHVIHIVGEYNKDKYKAFIDEYKDREITQWKVYGYVDGISLSLEFE